MIVSSYRRQHIGRWTRFQTAATHVILCQSILWHNMYQPQQQFWHNLLFSCCHFLHHIEHIESQFWLRFGQLRAQWSDTIGQWGKTFFVIEVTPPITRTCMHTIGHRHIFGTRFLVECSFCWGDLTTEGSFCWGNHCRGCTGGYVTLEYLARDHIPWQCTLYILLDKLTITIHWQWRYTLTMTIYLDSNVHSGARQDLRFSIALFLGGNKTSGLFVGKNQGLATAAGNPVHYYHLDSSLLQ